MKIRQINTQSPLRNFTYIIEMSDNSCICIDPYDGQQIEKELEQSGHHLKYIINTHEHHDHVAGNSYLLKKYQCRVFDLDQAKDDQKIQLEDEYYLKIFLTPGHTLKHISLMFYQKEKPIAIFSGDTLFNAGVGNCRHGGDPEILFETIVNFYANIPDDVVLYPGHDYIENNLKFSLSLVKNNLVENLLVQVQANGSMLTNIALEKKINLFFQLDNKVLREKLGISYSDENKKVFLALRKLRDQW